MDLRNITDAEVEATLAHAYRQEPSRASGNLLYFGRVKERSITVVVRPGSHPPHIVTAWD